MASVSVEQFTDPFSPWCWAAQPTLRRLRYEFDDVAWTPRMTLLVPPNDGAGGGGDGEGGPEDGGDGGAMRRTRWAASAGAGGMPVADGLWADALPSSRRACETVAFVRETAPGRALDVLRRLRVAAIAEGRPLGDAEAVAAVAGEADGVEAAAVRRGLADGRATDALAEDLERAVEAAGDLDSVDVRGDVSTLPGVGRLQSLGRSDAAAASLASEDAEGTADGGGSGELALLGPPALRVEGESVVVADPRVAFSRLASALGRAVPRTGIDIEDKFGTGRMAMHVPREVAESLSAEDFGETVRPYLERFGRAYLPEVVAATGVSTGTCRDALDALVDRGRAERVGPAEWRIVDEPGGPG